MNIKWLFLLSFLLSVCIQAAESASISFTHKDWELACDNTRTCRAAGYQGDDGDDFPVSVLLTRKAGPNQLVASELMLGDFLGDGIQKVPTPLKVTMKINHKNLGSVTINPSDSTAKLSEQQTAALITALVHNSKIEWSAGGSTWALSDKGVAAVLLKMDEFQGRIGTTEAILKKGTRNEDAVLPALPVPIVIAAPVPKPKPNEKLITDQQNQTLIKTILAQPNISDECFLLVKDEENDPRFSVARLSNTKLLLSALCWQAAYNEGYGHWVINAVPPHNPTLVTTMADAYDKDGWLLSSLKGRGIGDCWSSAAWVWDGQAFVHTAASTTGMCKLIAAGGAWSLPTLVTDVRKPTSK